MKNAVAIIVNISLGIVLLFILLTITGRMNRSMEIKSNFSSVAEEVVENMGDGAIYGSTQMVEADFLQQFSERLDGTAELTVEVEKVDVERGLLAVKVTETWKHPNGKTGTVSDNRVVILNQLEIPELKEVTVKFYASKEEMQSGGNCYKCYHLYEGERAQSPVAPKKQGVLFDGWRDTSDYMADFSVPVQQDIIYYAAWK